MLALMMKLINNFSFFTWNFFTAKKRIKLGVSHTHFALVGLTVKSAADGAFYMICFGAFR